MAVRVGGRTRWRTVRTAYSYCSSNDPRVLVGLGDGDSIAAVRAIRSRGSGGTSLVPDELLPQEATSSARIDKVSRILLGKFMVPVIAALPKRAS